ncbi:MAG: S1 RNA-binding domain-containing protein [Victivallales bacterium]|nr:S1 RNA-binding domain-containing protein [Victivallales bacterium]
MDFNDFNRSIDKLNINFTPGEKVKGEIVAIDRRSIFVDINAKSEGIINREELLDKEGNLTVKESDIIEAYFVSDKHGEISLTVKMTGKTISRHLDEAYESGIPVEGKVTSERKGGYSVKIADRDAFCPYSQIDTHPGQPEDYIGNSFTFLITEMNRFNIVVSRRKLIEREKSKKLETLKEVLEIGDIIEGTVINIKPFGVFVDLDYVEGFIPVSELAWGRIDKPEDIVSIADRVKVEVKALDWDSNKITLSLKSAGLSWDDIAEKYPQGKSVKAKVVSLADFGAFAELEKGISGLIHISKLTPGKRIHHAKDAVSVGDDINVIIEEVDTAARKISLARDFSLNSDGTKNTAIPDIIEINCRYRGTIEGMKSFGIFVRLNPLKKGLLHISEIKKPTDVDISLKELNKKYPVGSEIDVVVKAIEGDKISLTLPENLENAEEADFRAFKRERTNEDTFVNTISDAFDKLGL